MNTSAVERDIQCSYRLYVDRGGGRLDEVTMGLQTNIGDAIEHRWQCMNLDVDDEYIWVHDCVVNPEFSSIDDPIAIDSRG